MEAARDDDASARRRCGKHGVARGRRTCDVRFAYDNGVSQKEGSRRTAHRSSVSRNVVASTVDDFMDVYSLHAPSDSTGLNPYGRGVPNGNTPPPVESSLPGGSAPLDDPSASVPEFQSRKLRFGLRELIYYQLLIYYQFGAKRTVNK